MVKRKIGRAERDCFMCGAPLCEFTIAWTEGGSSFEWGRCSACDFVTWVKLRKPRHYSFALISDRAIRHQARHALRILEDEEEEDYLFEFYEEYEEDEEEY